MIATLYLVISINEPMTDRARIQNHDLQFAPNDNNAQDEHHMWVAPNNADYESGLEDHEDQENIPGVVDRCRGGGGCHAGKRVGKATAKFTWLVN